MRLTVRQAMAFMMLMGVCLAVTRHVVAHWGPSEATTVAPIVLVTTNVLAWLRRSRWQVFWIGFGLCGWGYLTLAFGSPLAEYLPTASLLDGLHGWLYADGLPSGYGFSLDEGFAYVKARDAAAHAAAFGRAGQSLLSLVFALLGGCSAIVLFPAKAVERVPDPPDGSLLAPGWQDVTIGRP